MNQKGQYIVEYATLVALITAALIAMSTYVFRSIQATQQTVQEDFKYSISGEEF